MKSSDYFSNVYEPQKDNSVSYWKQRAIIDAEMEAQLENMLDWLYNETENTFRCIPEATLKSFKPDKIQFTFCVTKYESRILVTLYKYRNDCDSFGDPNYDIVKITFPFNNFWSVPEVYRNNWKNATTIIRNGNFEAYSGFYKKISGSFGKYTAVYTDSCDLETKFFSHYCRKL